MRAGRQIDGKDFSPHFTTRGWLGQVPVEDLQIANMRATIREPHWLRGRCPGVCDCGIPTRGKGLEPMLIAAFVSIAFEPETCPSHPRGGTALELWLLEPALPPRCPRTSRSRPANSAAGLSPSSADRKRRGRVDRKPDRGGMASEVSPAVHHHCWNSSHSSGCAPFWGKRTKAKVTPTGGHRGSSGDRPRWHWGPSRDDR